MAAAGRQPAAAGPPGRGGPRARPPAHPPPGGERQPNSPPPQTPLDPHPYTSGKSSTAAAGLPPAGTATYASRAAAPDPSFVTLPV
jgi:hypothetical protein